MHGCFQEDIWHTNSRDNGPGTSWGSAWSSPVHPLILRNLYHILLYCTALAPTHIKLLQLCMNISLNDPVIASILVPTLNSGDQQAILQLLLDCTTIIDQTQKYGTGLQDKVLYFGCTWCYNIHMKRIGLFDFR